MSRDQETNEVLDDVARVMRANIGQGKPLGMIEVGEAMGVVGRTVDNHAKGRTTGSMELASFVRFLVAYRDRFPQMTDPAIDAVCRAAGGRFVRDEGDPVSLDANGNGRPDPEDERIRSAQATGLLAENLSQPAADGEERVGRYEQARRLITAAERVNRITNRRGTVRN
jgi:hypothetical protein